MRIHKLIFASKASRQRGAGVPAVRLLEVRVLFGFAVLVLLGFVGWGWMQKEERHSYVSPAVSNISTAAGKE